MFCGYSYRCTFETTAENVLGLSTSIVRSFTPTSIQFEMFIARPSTQVRRQPGHTELNPRRLHEQSKATIFEATQCLC